MIRRHEAFDLKSALRTETYYSPSGNKQKIYIFNCKDCGIGNLQDNILILERAISYLKEHYENQN